MSVEKIRRSNDRILRKQIHERLEALEAALDARLDALEAGWSPWAENDADVTLAIGDRLVGQDLTASRTWTLPATFDAVGASQTNNEIWAFNADTSAVYSVFLTPASGDTIYYNGASLGTNTAFELIPGTLGILVPVADNASWYLVTFNRSVTQSVSAFEEAVSALSPDAWYKFRDADFSSQVTDSSGNGFHMLKSGAEAVRHSDKMRSTHPGGMYVPGVTNDAFATTGVLYSAASGGLDSLISGSTEFTVQIAVRMLGRTAAYNSRVFSIGSNNTTGSGTSDLVAVHHDYTNQKLQFRERYTTGVNSVSTTNAVDDGIPRLYTFRCKQSTGKKLSSQDDYANTSDVSSAWSFTMDTLAKETFVGGRTDTSSSATNRTAPFVIDHIAVWADTYLSDAQVSNLESLYQSEINALVPSEGLRLWFDASNIASLWQTSSITTPVTTNNQSVGAWTSLGRASIAPIQATGANQPTYKTAVQNSLPGVLGDGADHLADLSGSGLTADTQLSIYWVAAATTTETIGYAYCTRNTATSPDLGINAAVDTRASGPVMAFIRTTTASNTGLIGPSSQVNTSAHVYSAIRDTSSLNGWIDGAAVTGDTLDADGAGHNACRLFARRDAADIFGGHAYEILVFEGAHSASTRQSIENYLTTKWGIS